VRGQDFCCLAPLSPDELQTGLMRLAGGRAGELEGHLLRNFRNYAFRDSVPPLKARA
jgi:hypothetical protein